MERDHGRGLKHQHQQQQVAWTPGHNFGLSGCFSWPAVPQPLSSSYTCGYCKREFRSAQALGGHMNVHRRDRARLRQCCPAYAPSPNLIAAHHRRAAAVGPPLPNLNFVPPHCAGATTAEPAVYSFFSTTTTSAMKAAVQVNLELGISGGVCGHDGAVPEEGGLDLELRLGCPLE